jgi:serine/threonine protein kinase
MPPEQIMQKDLDHRADIFAFGVILFQCFSGEPPILAEQPAEYLHLNLAEPPRRLRALVPSLPERLERLLETMMAKDREHRPGAMVEIEEQLLEIGVAEGWLPVGFRVAAPDTKETTLWRRRSPHEAGATGKSDVETELETRTVTETEMTNSGEGHSAGTLVPVVRESSGSPPRRQLLIWGIAITVIGVLGLALFLMVINLPLTPSSSSSRTDLQLLPRPAAPQVVGPDQDLAVDVDGGVDASDGGLADTVSAHRDARPVKRAKRGSPPKRKWPRRPTLRPRVPKKEKDEDSFKKVPGGL